MGLIWDKHVESSGEGYRRAVRHLSHGPVLLGLKTISHRDCWFFHHQNCGREVAYTTNKKPTTLWSSNSIPKWWPQCHSPIPAAMARNSRLPNSDGWESPWIMDDHGWSFYTDINRWLSDCFGWWLFFFWEYFILTTPRVSRGFESTS